jgi:hypothetical protein
MSEDDTNIYFLITWILSLHIIFMMKSRYMRVLSAIIIILLFPLLIYNNITYIYHFILCARLRKLAAEHIHQHKKTATHYTKSLHEFHLHTTRSRESATLSDINEIWRCIALIIHPTLPIL